MAWKSELRAVLLAVFAAMLAVHTGACPVGAQDFYQGKSVTIIVGSGAGGGFDINARMLARHIGRHIPGRPDIIVSNITGAGGLTALRHFENVAAKDGTVLMSFNFGFIGMSKLSPETVGTDFRKLAWIGSISQDLTMCFTWHELGLKTIADLKARNGLHFGLAGRGGNEDINAKILKNVFGVQIKQITGYPGSAAQRLAIQRRELDGGCGSWNSLPSDWVSQKLINPVYRTGKVAAPDMPPDLPFILDLAPTPTARAVISLLTAHNQLGRPFVVVPVVPADRVANLRAAFDKTMADPAFLAEADKARMPVTPINAAESLRIVEEIYAAPDDIVALARKAIED